jgi:hypothetical protein
MLRNQVKVGRLPVSRWLAGGITAAVLAVVGLSGVTTSAQAALPDRFGFVLWDNTSGVVVPSGTSPSTTSVAVIGIGRYQVTFPGQGAPGGVAHVTAINDKPHWCQINNITLSSPNEVIGISCYEVGGVADPSSFSAIFSSSSGTTTVGRFGYVNSLPSGSLLSTYNSVAGTNTVTPGPPGTWTVKFAGLGTPGPIDGSWQATAVSQQIPARCKVAKWTSSASGQVAVVLCFDASGTPLNTQFTLTYQYQRALYGGFAPPKNFGYLWNAPPLGPATTNFNSQGATNTISGGTGPWLVTFPKLAVLPDDIEVTATGGGSEFCGLNTPWTHIAPDTLVRDVTCFDNGGTPANPGFLISDNSQS